jgi:hypothetical protein
VFETGLIIGSKPISSKPIGSKPPQSQLTMGGRLVFLGVECLC